MALALGQSGRGCSWLGSRLWGLLLAPALTPGCPFRFLQDLEQRLEADVLRFSVCDVVLQHCPAFRRVDLPYVTNQAYQERTYQRLL